MRRTITISVSDEIHSVIYERMRSRFYCTVSEYIRFLVRRDHRPETIKEEKLVYPALRTANQRIEDALREIDAERTNP